MCLLLPCITLLHFLSLLRDKWGRERERERECECLCVCVWTHVCVCVCVCVCVWEGGGGDREREGELVFLARVNARLTPSNRQSLFNRQICLDNHRQHTELHTAAQICCLTQSLYTDTRPTSPSIDSKEQGISQGSHQNANCLSHWYDRARTCSLGLSTQGRLLYTYTIQAVT